nr:N-acetylmuramoyl-L-alanine amidase [uncultured Sphingomonas sp.]
MTRIGFIAIHCSATPATSVNVDAAEIRRWHRAKGWRDIGYHYVIKWDGTVEKGRADTIPGAHEPKINSNSLAICLVGGSPPIGSKEHKAGLGEDNYTDAQWASLKTLVNDLHAKHPAAVVLGHRDVPGVRKACPSFDVKVWWARNHVK